MSEIIAIAALGKKTRYICKDSDLLWTIPEDLKRLKNSTNGHPLIMGRKTYESIGKPLPNRTNIVLTRNIDFDAVGCIVVQDKDEALEIARKSEGGEQIFIFGGAEIYDLYLDVTDKLMLTLVSDDKPGTAKFPEYDKNFKPAKSEPAMIYENAEGTQIPYQWVDFKRSL